MRNQVKNCSVYIFFKLHSYWHCDRACDVSLCWYPVACILDWNMQPLFFYPPLYPPLVCSLVKTAASSAQATWRNESCSKVWCQASQPINLSISNCLFPPPPPPHTHTHHHQSPTHFSEQRGTINYRRQNWVPSAPVERQEWLSHELIWYLKWLVLISSGRRVGVHQQEGRTIITDFAGNREKTWEGSGGWLVVNYLRIHESLN